MNIEQIATSAAKEVWSAGDAYIGPSEASLVEFLRRCLSKMAAQQDMEPVGWLCEGALYEVQQHRLFTGKGPIPGQEKLYTEAQLLAAQQRTAEACAKAVFEAKYFGYNVRAEDVRDAALNNWRKYL